MSEPNDATRIVISELVMPQSTRAAMLSVLDRAEKAEAERDEALAAMSSDGADAVGANQVLRAEVERLQLIVDMVPLCPACDEGNKFAQCSCTERSLKLRLERDEWKAEAERLRALVCSVRGDLTLAAATIAAAREREGR